MTDVNILAFDTSAAHCAAVLLSGGAITQHRFEAMNKGQNERLTPLLAEVMTDAGLAWHELNAIGVGIGPGNFTGIRIAVSAARGFGLGLDVPAIGVTALEAYAFGTSGLVTACIDARADQAYVQGFEDGLAGEPPQIIAVSDALELSDQVGNLITQTPFPIEAIAHIAAARLQAGDIQAPAPLYLRSADAALPRDPAPSIIP